jgi:hypothetical protein
MTAIVYLSGTLFGLSPIPLTNYYLKKQKTKVEKDRATTDPFIASV